MRDDRTMGMRPVGDWKLLPEQEEGGRDSLWQRILANPEDNFWRLLYAELLDEQSDRGSSDEARAQFIRAQISLTRRNELSTEERIRWEMIERNCLEQFGDRWLTEAGFPPETRKTLKPEFRRGFVEVVRLPLQLLQMLPVYAESNPITGVSLYDTLPRNLPGTGYPEAVQSQMNQINALADAVGTDGHPLLPRLRELKFASDCGITPENINLLLSHNRLNGLKTLTIDGVRNRNSDDYLATIARQAHLNTLENLALKNGAINNVSTDALSNDSPEYTNDFHALRRLDLSHNELHASSLSNFGPKLAGLKELVLAGNNFRIANPSDEAGLTNFSRGSLKKLRALDISHCNMADEEFRLLMQEGNPGTAFPHLKWLNVAANHLTDQSLGYLTGTPRPALKHLDVSHMGSTRPDGLSNLTPSGLKKMAESESLALESLGIGGVRCGGADELRELLEMPGMQGLLSLNAAKIPNAVPGLAQIKAEKTPKLLRLDLSDNGLTGETIVPVIERFRTLKECTASDIKRFRFEPYREIPTPNVRMEMLCPSVNALTPC